MLRFEKSALDEGIALYAGRSSADAGDGRLWALVGGLQRGEWSDEALPDQMTLVESWARCTCYVFCEGDVSAVDLKKWSTALKMPSGQTRKFIWCRLNDGAGDGGTSAEAGLPTTVYAFAVARQSDTTGTVSNKRDGAVVPAANIGVSLANQTGLRVVDDDNEVGFRVGDEDRPRVFVVRTDMSGPTSPNLGTTKNLCFLSLRPDEAGRIHYDAKWPEKAFNQFLADNPLAGTEFWGAELRYFYGGKDGSVKTIRYPFTPPPWRREQSVKWQLSARLDTLEPHSPAGTGWTVAGESLHSLKSPYFRSINGRGVEVVSREGSGFYLGRRPLPNQGVGGYLCPYGDFDIRPTENSGGRLMCGLSGTERLEVQTGDTLHLLADQPAMASCFSPDAAVDPTLEATFSTSWVVFEAGGRGAESSSRRGYFSQPSSSVYYAGEEGRAYPTAVEALVRSVGEQVWPAVPVVPYGAVFESSASSKRRGVGAQRPVNPEVDAEVVARFESSVLSAQRFRRLRGSDDAAVAFQRGQTPVGAGAVTPQGLVAKLNDGDATPSKPGSTEAPAAGTWKELVFARCGDQRLGFSAGDDGCVKPELVRALMKEDLFLVLNRWDAFTCMDYDLEVADFHFRFRPLEGSGRAYETILVFKYATGRSLADLVGEPASWSDPGSFVARGPGGQPCIDQAQQVLYQAQEIAESTRGNPNDPFVFFREQVWSQPGWTGVVAFNCPIDGNGMPPQMQMLLGGIDGPLRAHHVGVANNQVSRDQNQAASIERSSIFGTIFYDAPPWGTTAVLAGADEDENDATYQVERLEVVIANSTLSDFHARVALGIEHLFGRSVTMADAGDEDDGKDNRLVVLGRYEKQGAHGAIRFRSKDDQIFRPPGGEQSCRVVEATEVTGASLYPLSSSEEGDGDDKKTTVRACFVLRGQLFFAANPFELEADEAVDLYTYGQRGDGNRQGLIFDKLNFDISFELDAQGQADGKTKVVEDLQDLTVKANESAQRKGGVVAKLPLKLKGIHADKKGLSKSALKGDEVHVLELREQRSGTPHYALEFSLPLGSLGALAGAHASLDASMLLCWGPKTATPDEDGAAVWMQLPGVSGGYKGFNLQGILKTVFGDANLARVPNPNGGPEAPEDVWVLLFNNIALSVLGMKFPPQVMVDFIIFADPDDPAGSNLGWSVSAVQITDDEAPVVDEHLAATMEQLQGGHDG